MLSDSNQITKICPLVLVNSKEEIALSRYDRIIVDMAFNNNILGSPNPKKWLSFGFVGIFEYIILPMLIIFLGMCPNSYGWMPSL